MDQCDTRAKHKIPKALLFWQSPEYGMHNRFPPVVSEGDLLLAATADQNCKNTNTHQTDNTWFRYGAWYCVSENGGGTQ